MNTVDKTKKYTEEDLENVLNLLTEEDLENVLSLLIESGLVVEVEETEGGEDEYYTPDRILRSGDATIVFWRDGEKTVVKKASDEEDNEYVAFCSALAKKIFGSNNAVKKIAASVEVKKK